MRNTSFTKLTLWAEFGRLAKHLLCDVFMVSPSKRKADNLETKVNGTESKRVRTETPSNTNGVVDGWLTSSDSADRLVQEAPPDEPVKWLKRQRRRKLRQRHRNDEAKSKAETSEEVTKPIATEEELDHGNEEALHNDGEESKSDQDEEVTKPIATEKGLDRGNEALQVNGEESKSDQEEAPPREVAPNKQPSLWVVTHPVGGTLADLDPIFSHDEQYVPLN